MQSIESNEETKSLRIKESMSQMRQKGVKWVKEESNESMKSDKEWLLTSSELLGANLKQASLKKEKLK